MYIYYSCSILWPYCYIIIHCFLNMIDVKSGLINTAQLNNLYWSPWMNNLFCFALINQPPVLKSHLFDPKFVISNSLSFSSCLINLRTHHCYTEVEICFVLFSNSLYFQMVSLCYTQVETSWTPEPITADHWTCEKKLFPKWSISNQILDEHHQFG